jgi:AcrR family transcriptional regulator
MSKSAVFAHFGSKAALEAAVVDAAAADVHAAVTLPAATAPDGIARLIALTEGWLAQPTAGPLAVLTSIDAGLSEDARTARAAWRRAWLAMLATELTAAVRAGELAANADVAQAAFELDALLIAGRHGAELGDTRAAGRVRRAVETVVRRLSHPALPSP